MTYIVARPGSRPGGLRDARSGAGGAARYEIRESVSTPAGPRARTLATFRVLTAGVIADAAARARTPFDAAQVRERAAALGVPQKSSDGAASGAALLAQLRRGESLPPALAAELRRLLPRRAPALPDSLESAVEWIGVDDETRGRALRDLLDVASRIPPRPRPPASSFPRLSSARPA
jgi:hypothetical protein